MQETSIKWAQVDTTYIPTWAGFLYARVSTAEQTIEHQAAHARAAGFVIDEVVADNGVSGLSTRLTERPEGRRLFDKLRKGDPLVGAGLQRAAAARPRCSGVEAELVLRFEVGFGDVAKSMGEKRPQAR